MRATMIAKTADAITCRRLDRSPCPARKYADGARPFAGEGGIAISSNPAGSSTYPLHSEFKKGASRRPLFKILAERVGFEPTNTR